MDELKNKITEFRTALKSRMLTQQDIGKQVEVGPLDLMDGLSMGLMSLTGLSWLNLEMKLGGAEPGDIEAILKEIRLVLAGGEGEDQHQGPQDENANSITNPNASSNANPDLESDLESGANQGTLSSSPESVWAKQVDLADNFASLFQAADQWVSIVAGREWDALRAVYRNYYQFVEWFNSKAIALGYSELVIAPDDLYIFKQLPGARLVGSESGRAGPNDPERKELDEFFAQL